MVGRQKTGNLLAPPARPKKDPPVQWELRLNLHGSTESTQARIFREVGTRRGEDREVGERFPNP